MSGRMTVRCDFCTDSAGVTGFALALTYGTCLSVITSAPI